MSIKDYEKEEERKQKRIQKYVAQHEKDKSPYIYRWNGWVRLVIGHDGNGKPIAGLLTDKEALRIARDLIEAVIE